MTSATTAGECDLSELLSIFMVRDRLKLGMGRVQALGLLTLVLAAFRAECSTYAQHTLAITGARIETVSELGSIADGTILIRDGKILEIGAEVDVPVAAKVISASGKTLMPGIVDPYFVVPVSRSRQAPATRTVVFRGRTFVINSGPPPIATDFLRVADGFDASKVDWSPALRSGITGYHLVTAGFAQSGLAQRDPENVQLEDPDGWLHVTATNSTKSLDVLRNGLSPNGRDERNSRSPSGKRSAGSPSADSSGRTDRPGRGQEATTGRRPATSDRNDPTQNLWSAVQQGEAPLFVNVNNASAILHVCSILEDNPKAQVVLIASGEDVVRTIDNLEACGISLLLAPDIDEIPNSRNRINVPRLLSSRNIDFAFSLSLGQSDFRRQQHTPLFAVGMLVRSGLDRTLALEGLTLSPAKLLGIDRETGSLEVGKRANFLILDGDPFAATTAIEQVFVEGKPIHDR